MQKINKINKKTILKFTIGAFFAGLFLGAFIFLKSV